MSSLLATLLLFCIDFKFFVLLMVRSQRHRTTQPQSIGHWHFPKVVNPAGAPDPPPQISSVIQLRCHGPRRQDVQQGQEEGIVVTPHFKFFLSRLHLLKSPTRGRQILVILILYTKLLLFCFLAWCFLYLFGFWVFWVKCFVLSHTGFWCNLTIRITILNFFLWFGALIFFFFF